MSIKAINAYQKGTLKQDLANADPHKITLMLMQGALDKLAYAKGCIDRNDLKGRAEHVSKAMAIFLNLRDTLDLEVGGSFSENLFALYNYIIDKLVSLNSDNGIAVIDEVSALFLPIKDAWAQIPESAKQEAYARASA
ncbi:flagellar export chaperone FliS [Glaciecola sp. XM2]|jgi:flagellar protein FliS|uniref:flagellar export chaperone FliS n=1 Tax=Glaciecola sp. XM2 TaxID=1914931 RepID=UPI001BDE6A0D|nr:flagellar export chaperone FliS [Glaciecola sp. XM2]MBT1450809.1 flagellar export chaperone FliS [Glaciecola sp. XM2]